MSDPAASVNRLLKVFGAKLPRAIKDEILAHGDAATPPLLALVASGEVHAAQHAAALLVERGVAQAVEPLLALLLRTTGSEEPDLPDPPVDALATLGAPIVEPALRALEATTEVPQRRRLLRALARCGVRDVRILDALLAEVRALVPNAALALADYGDPVAVAPLAALYDSIELTDPGRCTVALDLAVPLLKLQGELTDAQQDRYTQVTARLMEFVKGQVAELRKQRAASLADLDAFVDDGDRALEGDDADEDAGDAEVAKVDRNAACPCGSGKKYKRCHGA